MLGSDGRIRIVSAEDGGLVSGPLGPGGGAQSVVWSPDSAVVAVASGRPGGLSDSDQSVRLWDAVSGKEVGSELRHRDDIRTIAFSGNGEWIGTGGEDYSARIWDRRSGRAVGQPLRHSGWVVALAFSPNGKIFVTGSSDGFLRLWETAGGEAIGPAIRTTAEPKFLAFDDAGDFLVAGFAGYYLRWDLTLPSNMRADVSRHVALASGMRLNAEGVLQPLSGTELVELWATHRRHLGTNQFRSSAVQ
jgi:WD40 repeat protein